MPEIAEDPNELRRLRELVYGVDGGASAADIVRLSELERPQGAAGFPDAEPDPDPDPRAPASGGENAPASTLDEPDLELQADASAGERPPRRLRRRRTILLAVVGAVVVAAAFVAGVQVATPPAPDAFPELLLPQTQEDVVLAPRDDPVAATIDPFSARFIARFDDFDVFLARPADSAGVCLLTRDAGSFALLGVGCAEGEDDGLGISFSATGGVTLVAGEIPTPQGYRIRLSESVSAYRS